MGWVGVLEIGYGVIGMGGVGIGLLNGSSTHFLFNPTLILVAAVGLIINTQSDTADKSSIRGSSNELHAYRYYTETVTVRCAYRNT